ncbi:MAG: heme NO-binding domain-containing protein [Saprospiraceae bacterium]|nr:heme NO-binding domain-containing protein [Saprospiraceae bacterium]
MKGIVFTQFIEMVEQQYGYEIVDELLTNTNLPSGGAYTAIGTYSHHEIVCLVVGLSKRTNIPVPALLNAFGRYLFCTFSRVYDHFFEHFHNAFDFLENVDNYIHVEVIKLYPDAELPQFTTKRLDEKRLEMISNSERSMGDLAEGLIAACIEHYKETASINREKLTEDAKSERFLIVRAS